MSRKLKRSPGGEIKKENLCFNLGQLEQKEMLRIINSKSQIHKTNNIIYIMYWLFI